MMNISRSIVFIDAAIDDCQQLAGGVHPNVDVVILRPDVNAIQQITAVLRKNAEIDDVHIVAHGFPGCLFLGNESLSLATVERYAAELGQWFRQPDTTELPQQPTLRIYGCNVAAGDAGAEFLDHLHRLTGAAIYASQQLVGSAAQGGTWQLEAAIAPSPSVDQINRDTDAQRSASLVFSSETLQTYAGVFAAPSQANLIFSPTSPVNEGTTVNLNGTFQDEVDQTHTIQINWGDGTVVTVPAADIFDSGTGAYSFNIDHTYLDNPTSGTAYTVTVTVTDSENLTSTTTNLFTVNNLAPSINEANPVLNVTEDATTAATLTLTATDPGADTLTWSVSQPAQNGVVAIDPATGQISYTPNANFSGTDSVTVRVSDGDGGTDTVTVGINVTAVNDAPSLTGNAQLPNVNEDVTNPAGQTVSSLFSGVFTDIDPGSSLAGIAIQANTANSTTQGRWQYSTNGGGSWFGVGTTVSESSALFLSANTLVRFVPASNFSGEPPALTVRAIDNSFTGTFTDGQFSIIRRSVATNGGTTPYSASTGLLSITVIPQNDAPVIDPAQPFTISVPEGSLAETSVATFLATDPEGDPITWELIDGNVDVDGDGVDAFRLSSSGQLIINDADDIDFESGVTSFNLVAEVTDDEGASSQATFTVNITNVDEPPAIDPNQNLTFSLAEDAPLNTVVGTLAATDSDPGSVFTWTILSGNGPDSDTDTTLPFGINSNGEIFVADPDDIDFESGNTTYTLEVQVADQTGLTDTVTVTINLTNVNEAPEITTPVGPFDVSEDTPQGAVVGAIAATDPDGDSIIWSIAGDNPDLDGDGNGAFAIDSNGNLIINDADDLDFETLPNSFDLEVTAADASGATDTEIVTVNVTAANEAPTDIALSNDIVDENTPGATVGTLTVTDPDAGDTFTFTVDDPRFVFNGSDLQLAADVSLDYETEPTVTIEITATDAGGLSYTETFTINVFDLSEAPVIAPGQVLTVPENSPEGTTVGTVSAADPEGDISNWLIDDASNADADGDGEFAFGIDGSGSIFVNDADEIDFETTPTYTLGVTAIDEDGNISTENVTVNVTNVNEPPIITPGQVFTIPENSPIGSLIGTPVDVTDPENNFSRFRIIDGNVDNDGDGVRAFGISPAGQLFVLDNGDLNFEAFPTSYTLTLEASDRQGLISTETITINVTNVNEPPFIPAGQAFDVDENSPTGTEVGTIVGNDPDGDIASWQIVSGDPNGAFTIDADGVITVADPALLDFEAGPTSYTLQVTATDSGGVTSSPRNVIVTVNNINEAPVITEPLPALDVDENAANGTVVGTIAATDPENNIVSWEIVSPDNDGDGTSAFAIDNNGQITVADGDELDFESLMSVDVEVTVTDAEGLSDTATVTIELNPVNEAPDVEPDQSFTISEGAANNDIVGAIAFTDVDGVNEVGSIEFVDNDGDGTAAFGVDANNNIIVTDADELDFETNPIYTLDVTVTDAGGLSDTETVTITVTDVVEPPEITPGQVFTVPEDSEDGTAVGTVEAVDSDGDIAAWEIFGGNVDADDDGELLFEIDGSGNITVNDGDELDFETTPTYTLDVRVIDGQGNEATDTVTVNVGDVNEPPIITPGQVFNIAENSPLNTTVGTVAATDLEGNLAGFRIVSGNPNNDGDGVVAFGINNQGRIFVTDPGDLNFEAFPTSYTLTVEARDSLGLTSTETITVNITNVNEPPFIPAGQAFDVDENSPTGTEVGTVLGNDPDGNIANWEILTGDTNGTFAIDADGVITVADPALLDFEAGPTSYTLQLRATDADGQSSTRNVTVTVNNVQEAPIITEPLPALAVDENAANGTVVGTIAATDPENDIVGWEITSPDADGDGTPAFAIDDNGQITVADGDELDFESLMSVDVDVTVTDSTGLTDTATVTIELNPVNEAPDVEPDQSFTISEGAANNDIVGAIAFTDVDGVNEVGSIEFVDNDGDGTAAFGVDANNNIIVTDADELDFETNPIYTLDVTITDEGGLSDTETVTINLTNVEEPPVIAPDQVFTIPENSMDGDAVGTVEAVDSDGDIAAWAILSGNVDTDNDGELLFEIDNAGNITVNDGDELDFETTPSYDLGVRVIDGQGNIADATVTVEVDNVNEPPTVDPGQTFTVPENSPIGTAVGTVTATDLEDNLAGFQIVGGNPDNDNDGTGAFSINNSGQLFVIDPGDLNYEAFPIDYTLTIQATDAEGLSSTGTITVSVTDENEPPFIAPDQTFSVDENSPSGTVFGTVDGGDPDADPNNQIANWEIVLATNPDNDTDGTPAFEISPTGELTVLDPEDLDAEAYPTEYTLTVRAVDGQGESSSRDITVIVNDVNEAPVVDPGQAFTVDENAENGTVVGDITFTDPDANDTITGSIEVVDADGDGTPAFSVQNGQIIVTDGDEIDFETNPTYTLNVTVTDAGGLSSTESVTIDVNDVNEAPVITTVDPVFEIDEGQPVDTLVGTIEFTDPDTDPANVVSSVTINSPDGDGDGTPIFSIDLDGNITVTDADELDFELFPTTYTLEVEVSDGELSDTTTVTINVNDANELPVIEPGQVFTVAETTANGTTFGTVAATDDDGTLIGWTIVDGNPDTDGDGIAAFRINSATGALVVNDRGDLDQEAAGAVASYDLTVQVGDGIGTSQEVITVTVEDIDQPNDDFANAIPLAGLTDSDTGSNVDATAETGEPVLSGPSNSVWWTWTAPTSGIVSLDTLGSGFDTLLGVYTGTSVDALIEVATNDDATGSVQSAVQFVATQGETYYFLVDGFQTQTGDVQISLNLDPNEPPVIEPDQSFVVPENSPQGTVVGTVAASDADDGVITNWAITDGNVDLDGDGTPTFSISDTGQIIVEDGDELDFESKTVFSLEITVEDSLGEVATQPVTVTVSNVNEAPTVATGLSFDVVESATNGTTVGTVTATDPDGNADVVAWSISDADNPDLDGDGTRAFAISNTGVITVADTDDIDFEAAAPITQLNVTATDAGGLSGTAVVGINVTNAPEAPVIDPGQSFEIDESIPDTTVVGTITASDPENDITDWSISDASNPDLDGDGTRAFAIDATGQITVADTDDINFTVADTITLEVTATDATDLSDTESVVISVNDTNQAPAISDGQSFTVLENSATGTTVGAVLVDDSDGNVVNWEITGGNPDNDGDGSPGFTISSEGVITVVDSDELDFESNQSYDLQITVIDNFNASDTATVTVQIEDDNEAPTIQLGQTFSVDEGAAISTSIGSVFASDPDAGDSLTWAIIDGNVNLDNDGAAAFGINPTTGELFVTDGADIDANVNDSVSLLIQVTDEAGNTASETVVINVNDINEPPVIPAGQQFTVGENAANGTPIGTVVDADPEDNVTSWSIVSGNPDNDTDGTGAFAIDAAGLLTVADADDLDFEAFSGPYTVRVQAGDGEFTIQQDITIAIQNENDPPVINPDQTFAFDEGSPNGTVVGAVIATDPEDNIVSWAITAGNPDEDNDGIAAFTISNAGQIAIADSSEIDFETLSSYSLTVQVTDNLGAQDTETITLTVNDVNEPPLNLQLQPIANTVTDATINLIGSFVDPDQDDSHTLTILWGDGTSPTTTTLAGGDTAISASYVYTTPGDYTIDVTVADTEGQVQTTQTLQVGNSRFPDFNRDGLADLVWRNYSSGQNSLWYLNANNERVGGGSPPPATNVNWVVEGVGDFDGDGQDDLTWRNSSTGQNAVWLMDGSQRLSVTNLDTITNLNWRLQGVGTFEAGSSRRDDLIWRNQSTGQNVIWVMDGTTRTGTITVDPVASPSWEIAGVGDFDGDGRLSDVIWRNYSTGQNSVWFINPDGTKTTQALPALANTAWRIEGASDFDGDGRANDLLWRNSSTGATTTWFIGSDFSQEGTQTLSPQVTNTSWRVVV